jgi:hypothetical protein
LRPRPVLLDIHATQSLPRPSVKNLPEILDCCGLQRHARLVAMNATKILWGQVLLIIAVVLAFLWAATEWTAWRLAFQPQLGPSWFEILGWPVYQPPAFFWWWFAYDAYARAGRQFK